LSITSNQGSAWSTTGSAGAELSTAGNHTQIPMLEEEKTLLRWAG
jgi:hypothetical protein